MPLYLNPNNVAFAIIAFLLILAAVPVMKAMRHKLLLRKRFVLLEIPESYYKDLKLNDIIKSIPVPFVFEIAVHHLGEDVRYYLAIPERRVQSVVKSIGAIVATEYNIYHPGGSHMGFYLKSDALDLDLKTVDFSRVNEVGEGVVAQFVAVKGKGAKRLTSFRILISAPTPYQAQEIAFGINSSISEFKPVAVTKKLPEFINKVNYREFDVSLN